MNRLKKGDTVVVIAGRSKNHISTIIELIDDKHVLVKGANMVKKHVKPNPQKQIQGAIITKEAKIHISNVAHLNPRTNKPDKIGYKFVSVGDAMKKVRYFKSDNELIDTI